MLKDVTIFHYSNIMLTDRHMNGKFSFAIGQNRFTIVATGYTIHLHLTSCYGIIAVLVIHFTTYFERRFVGEVDLVEYRR